MLDRAPGKHRSSSQPSFGRLDVVRAIVLGVLLAAAISAVLLIPFFPSNQVFLNAGDVSSADIQAPYDLTYESEIRTKQARDAEAASVSDIYDPPDASVARRQEVRARQILDYLSTVREDPYASPEDKASWIAAVPDLELSPEIIDLILSLAEDDWQQVKEETVRVLVRAM